MKKKIIGIMVMSMFVSCGCGKINYPDLPQNAIAFEMNTFEDTEHDNALFGAIEYNGRTYIGYGTINSSYKEKNIDECIGYIVCDEKSSSYVDLSDTNRRVYTLSEDTEHNFLLEYDDSIGLMNQPIFLRATDTKGMDMEKPKYIDELGYEFWE